MKEKQYDNQKSLKKEVKGKKYRSLMEFALFGEDDEEINLDTMIATKKSREK